MAPETTLDKRVALRVHNYLDAMDCLGQAALSIQRGHLSLVRPEAELGSRIHHAVAALLTTGEVQRTEDHDVFEMVENARTFLERFQERWGPFSEAHVTVEEEVSLDVAALPFVSRGRLDLCVEYTDAIHVIDWKTGWARDARADVQASMYLSMKSLGAVNKKLYTHIVYLRTGFWDDPVEWTETELGHVREKMVTTGQRIVSYLSGLQPAGKEEPSPFRVGAACALCLFSTPKGCPAFKAATDVGVRVTGAIASREEAIELARRAAATKGLYEQLIEPVKVWCSKTGESVPAGGGKEFGYRPMPKWIAERGAVTKLLAEKGLSADAAGSISKTSFTAALKKAGLTKDQIATAMEVCGRNKHQSRFDHYNAAGDL